MEFNVKNIFNCDGDHIVQYYVNGEEVPFYIYDEALNGVEDTDDCDEDCENCSYCKYADDEPETIKDIITRYRNRIKDNGCLCSDCLDAILGDYYEEIADKIIEEIDED